jgi:predicted anti-sigma-YlaC factor YlaD
MSEHVHTPQCKQLLSHISDYVDGDLPPELCVTIAEHLKNCENCRIVVDTLKKTIEIYKETTPLSELPEDVRERLFLKLHLDEHLAKH